MTRPDEDDISQPMGDQFQPAKNEGAQDDLTKLGVGLHKRAQVLTIQLDQFTGLSHARPGERPSTREHVGLAGESAWSVYGNKRLARPRRTDNLDFTCSHDKKGHDPIACLDKNFSAFDVTHAPVEGNTRDLSRCQCRKQLVSRRGKGRFETCDFVAHGVVSLVRMPSSTSAR